LDEIQNHAWNAIKKLARFGIYFHDHSEHEINKIFTLLEKLPKYQGIGSGRFKNGNQPCLGLGKTSNLDIAFGGPVHRILLKLQAVNWNLDKFDEKFKNVISPISVKRLIKLKKQSAKSTFNELTEYFSCYEWINTDESTSIPKNPSAWRYIDIGKLIKAKYPTSFWKLTNEEISRKAHNILSMEDVITANDNKNTETPSHRHEHNFFWEKIMNSKSPIFVATDGSHQESKQPQPAISSHSGKHHSASSFVICQADMSKNTEANPDNWIHSPCLPLLCRISSLPKCIGTDTSNIAHAESHAIAMQEWALPPHIPRILITDSKSVRNVCLGLRSVESKKKNRMLIRKLMGGISKFITSDIFVHLQQRKFDESTNHPKPTNSTIETLENRIKNILLIASNWSSTPASEEENLIDATYGIWRKDYFDDDITRTIFQVNSHQLNSIGSDFNKKKRYAKLTPNLSLLNMNHHADQGAELGRILDESYRQSNNSHLPNPTSALRFFLSWEGSTIDTHISDFIRKKIFTERLIRLKTKKTQGLLYRTMDHVTATWEDLGRHKGWKRSLAGLSRTHTRSLYKSETYRSGCHIDLENKEICQECDQIPPTRPKDIIKKCASCMWCPTFRTQPSPEGNRNHLFLQCQHPHIASFREKMTNLIEQKLRFFLSQIQNATDKNFFISLLKKLETECSSLQATSLLTKPTRNNVQKRFTYVKLDDLMEKYEINNLQEGFSVSNPFFSEALGILPQSIAKNVTDENLKVLDVFWLGLIPASFDHIITSHCNSSNLFLFTPNITACKALSNECLSTWREIKDLIMAKAIGIHRIVGTISKEKEKAYRKKYKLAKGTYRDPIFRAEMKRKRKCSHISPSPDDPKTNSNTTANTISPTNSILEPPQKILCNGITCNKKNKRWYLDQKFSQNRIEPTKKHCLRCSRFSTSIKHSANILDSIGNNTSNSNLKPLQIKLLDSASNGIPYRSMMNMLEENKLASEPTTGAQFNKKHKITDSHKTICRIITHSFKTANTIEYEHEHEKFTATATKIQDGLTFSRNLLKQSKKKINPITHAATTTYNDNNHDNSNPIVIDQSPTSLHDSECRQNTELSKNLERLQNQVLTEGEFVSDDAITMAVEVLRQNTEERHIFIANGLANVIINNWSPTKGWERFARIFNSQHAVFTKENGCYMIPMYRPGHWYLVIIHKINRTRCEGWILDSLRKGDPNSISHTKIKDAFIGTRGRFNWNTPECWTQTENECGPRTIKSISVIKRGIRDSVSIADSIAKATMMNRLSTTYDASGLRQEMSSMLNLHCQEMRPQRLVFRETGAKVQNATKSKRKRFKRNRRRR